MKMIGRLLGRFVAQSAGVVVSVLLGSFLAAGAGETLIEGVDYLKDKYSPEEDVDTTTQE
jgi:hypothetical protein